jgi:multidrug resistance efflux pump
MIGVAHHGEPRMATLTAALRAFLQTIRDRIESYAEYRAERAVSAAQWQNADDEIRRYRRLIQAGK